MNDPEESAGGIDGSEAGVLRPDELNAVPVARWQFHAEISADGVNGWRTASETVEMIDGKLALDIGHDHMAALSDGNAYLRIVTVCTK
jgi:hypothetical protein